MGKLTLSMDKEVIDNAKAFCRAHGTSLSKRVAKFFRCLESESRDPFLKKLHEELLAEGFQPSTSDETAFRDRHIRKKYL